MEIIIFGLELNLLFRTRDIHTRFVYTKQRCEKEFIAARAPVSAGTDAQLYPELVLYSLVQRGFGFAACVCVSAPERKVVSAAPRAVRVFPPMIARRRALSLSLSSGVLLACR